LCGEASVGDARIISPESDYPDFYVAILTLVPIALAGQFVVLRQVQGSSLRLRRRFVVVMGHVVSGWLALGSIGLALLVLGGFSGDEPARRL
jgi:hypothetical protein